MGGASRLHVADVDGDGDLDVLGVTSRGATAASKTVWFENEGNEQMWTTHTIKTNFDGVWVYGVDIDLDGDMDVLAAAKDNNDIVWFENNDEMPTQ